MEIEIEPSDDSLYIKPTEDMTRKDWEKKFSHAINQGQEPEDDYVEGFHNDYDERKWTWLL